MVTLAAMTMVMAMLLMRRMVVVVVMLLSVMRVMRVLGMVRSCADVSGASQFRCPVQ